MPKTDSRTLLLYYDEYHTPIKKIKENLGAGKALCILEIEIDFHTTGKKPAIAGVFEGMDFAQENGRDEFADHFISRAIKANACYQRGYNLSAALSRPFLASKVVAYLKAHGISNLIHGFAGNDQVRFEMGVMVLAPQINIQSVSSLLGSQNQVNLESYTISSNIWGRSVEGFKLEDPWVSPEAGVFERVTIVTESRAQPIGMQLRFEKGIPVAINNQEMPLATLLGQLDQMAKPYYLGVADMMEDGFVGLKTRAVYEYPSAWLIRQAHQDLESLVLTRKQSDFKALADRDWSGLIYDGLWFDPQRESLETYMDDVSRLVTGSVKILLSCGGSHVVGRESRYALYDKSLAIYRAGQDFGIGSSGDLTQAMSTQMRASANRDTTNH